MPDIHSLHLALGAMSQKEREDFLGKALSQQTVETQDAILQRLDLKELPVNSRVQLVFRMGLSPVAHAFRAGQNRQLQWVIPQVPDHLRSLVYSTSRLISEFQETLVCLQNGRGDFVKAFSLLNPETMLEMVNRFGDEMQAYTQQLREANGRFNRSSAQRPRRTPASRPSGDSDAAPMEAAKTHQDNEAQTHAPAESEPEQKTRKTTARSRTKAQAPETELAEATPGDEANQAKITPADSASQAEAQGDMPTPDAGDGSITPSTAEELAAFGFDVLGAAADIAAETTPDDSEK